jgi:hypothetical protein
LTLFDIQYIVLYQLRSTVSDLIKEAKMQYAFIQDVPADAAMYGQIRAKLGDDAPKGLVAHIAIQRSGGLRYLDVWDTKADWERFSTECVEPAVGEVLASYGLPHDHSLVTLEEVEVIDTWLGS